MKGRTNVVVGSDFARELSRRAAFPCRLAALEDSHWIERKLGSLPEGSRMEER